MPFKIIFCDACNFEAHTTCLCGQHDYILNNGHHLNIEQTLGWCNSCNGFQVVEDLSDKERLIGEIEAYAQKLADARDTGLLNRLLMLFGKDRNYLQSIKEKIKENQQRLEFLGNRESPARCLTCSSTDVKSIEFPALDRDSTAQTIGITHPDCGGNLWVRNSDIWISIVHTTREYSPEGKFIHEIRPEFDDEKIDTCISANTS